MAALLIFISDCQHCQTQILEYSLHSVPVVVILSDYDFGTELSGKRRQKWKCGQQQCDIDT